MRSATRSEIVTRVRPVSRATSARLCAPARVERLQDERAVVAASVLGQHLAGGPEGAGPREDRRTAERCGEHVGTRVRGAALADLASLRIRRHVC